MKGLLTKEKIMMFSSTSIKWYIVLALFFGCIGVFGKMTSWLVFIGFLLTMLPYTSLNGDELSGWESYSLTMPVSRRDFVNSKYIITLAMYGISFVFVLVFLGIYALMGKDAVSTAKYILPISAALPLFMPSLGLPLTFKFGSEKGRVMQGVIGGLCGIVCSFALTMTDAVSKFSGSLTVLYLALILGAMVFFAVSWFASIKIFESREF